jgi:uncharacterized protein YggE
MVLRRFFIASAAIAAICYAANNARAQFSAYEMAAMGGGAAGQNTISATGASVINRLPTSLRVIVPLSGKGKTIEEAMAKLKELRETASAQVQKLKADKKDIKFSNPAVSNAQSNRQRQMESLVAQRMGQGKKTPKGLQAPESVTLGCTMTVEWPIAAKTPDEILLESQALKQKIKAAELSGKKEAEKLTPEEEEMAAEMAEMARNQGEDPQAASEPQFLFVARITEEERQKAFAEAFAKAKKNGEELAKAAGIELGALVGVAGQGRGSQSYADDSYGGYSSSYYQRQMRMQQLADDPDQQSNESVAADPDSVAFTFGMSAVFKMGK